MNEIGRDAAHVFARVGEVARQIGGDVDKAYAAAKGFDWRPVVEVVVLLAAAGLVMGLVQILNDAKRNNEPANPAGPHPAPGDADYLDWANRTGKYTPPVAKTDAKTPQGPFRW